MFDKFDEKSPIWIDIYKKAVIITFWVLLAGGVLLGIFDITATIDILYDDNILDLLLWPVVGAILAFGELVCGMLIVNFLNNVQNIRMSIEKD